MAGITVEMLRKPLEKLGILMTKEQQLKVAQEREKYSRIYRIHIVENDRTIHELIHHSGAYSSEIEYVLGIK